MHPLKPLILVGISAAAATAENESACSPVSTIFVTVPASPTTETIYALSKGSIATAAIDALVNGAAPVTSNAVTMTVTGSVASTQVISVIQASSPAEGQALYSFTEGNGTTTWLGATPPASVSLITSTQTVTLQPVTPGYIVPQEGVTPVTSYLTLSSTETITGTRTETLAFAAASAMGGAYTGLASKGWNSSMSTLTTVKSPAPGSVTIAEKYHPGTAYPIAPSGIVPFPPGNATRHIKYRDVGDLVFATIDGVAVSWTNIYVGKFVSPSDTPTVAVPVTASALQYAPDSPLVSSTFASPVQIELSPPMAPTTTVAVYPWQVLPTASFISATTSHALLSSLYSNKSTSSSTSIAVPTSSCGNAYTAFTIDFDDLPAFSAGPENTEIPPILNPYHKLFFQQYFGYVPPPSDPFPPISPPQLAVYRVDGPGAINSPDAGLELPGEIGSGPRASDSAYWIDAYSAYLGCTNPGPESCSIMVRGYQNWSISSVITQGFMQPPCPGMKDCSLALVEFAEGFRNLTGLQISATVGITPVDWYMDNLSLGWSNNTCAAQLERSSQE